MGWVDVDEPLSAPPRTVDHEPGQQWQGTLDADRGWAEVVDLGIAEERLDLTDINELSVTESLFRAVSFESPVDDLEITTWRSCFENCDLSSLRFASARSTRFLGCKFVGADLADSRLDDVLFERCTFRYVNLRMSRLNRVAFVDCALDDVDVYDTVLTDVAFPQSRLTKLNVDRTKATRVDLRDASEIVLASIGRLDGFVVSEDQLPSLMYSMAFATGLGVERPADR